MRDQELSTLIVVPTYNEKDTIQSLLTRIRDAVPQAEILVVDDGSPDGTGVLADQFAASDAAVRVLHRAHKQGLGAAYRAGFGYGLREGYAYIAQIDADGSHDPYDLSPMLRAAQNGSDLVIGSRWVPGGTVTHWSRFRQLVSQSGNVYARKLLRSRVSDMTAGFRVYRSTMLRKINFSSTSSQGFSFQVEMTWRVEGLCGHITEYPINFLERKGGQSKMGWAILIEALWRIGSWSFRARVRPDRNSVA